MKTMYLFKRAILLVFVLFASIGLTYAQSKEITGNIVDAEGISLPAVTVIIKGTTTGTITDLDGNYTIKANEGDVLAFSFIGCKTQTITVGTSSVINITLANDAINLDELVVIGYGSIKKSDLTGSVAVISTDELNKKAVATFEQALQGLSPGVSVTSNSGAPGSGAVIRVRGVGSINSTDPLYVIDGVPVGGAGSTDPADIESIQVLKDAAACAIYGARGANGVVIITTKRGTKGKPKVTFDAYWGIQKAWKQIDLLNSREYAELVIEANNNLNPYLTGPKRVQDINNLENNTDWQDELFQAAPMYKYNLSVSGGGDYGTYSMSGGYLRQEGIMIGLDYEKYFFRVNTNTKVGKFRFGQSLALNRSTKENEKYKSGRSQIERMAKMTPTIAVYDEEAIGGYDGSFNADGHDAQNPVGVANLYDDQTITTGILGNVYGEVEIIKGLKYKLNGGLDYYTNKEFDYTQRHTMGNAHGEEANNMSKGNYDKLFTLIENTLTYNKTIGEHSFVLLAGYTEEQTKSENLSAGKKYTQDNIFVLNNGEEPVISNEIKENALRSFLGRVNYTYAGKYLFQANIRRDGSSRFGEDNRWAVFPSASVGWRVSEEAFLKENQYISNLKIRASYGLLGNQNIGDYQYESSLNYNNSYVLNGSIVSGVSASALPNPGIKWETTKQIDLGFELGLFNNRFFVEADYYKRETEDMLIQVSMPNSNGAISYPYQNAGSVRNTGIEFAVTYKKMSGDFNYSITGNFTTINNEVIKMGEKNEPMMNGTTELGDVTRTEVGQPIGSFYTYITDGLYKSQEQIDAMNKDGNIFAPNASLGDIRFKDLNNDGILNEEDRDFTGSAIPEFTYGLSANMSYKNIDFSIMFQGVYGNKIFNEMKFWTEGMFNNMNSAAATTDRYRAEDLTITVKSSEGNEVDIFYPANTDTDMPRAISGDPNKNAYKASDRYIEDGSYLRLKNISLGYTLPKSIVNKVKLSRARVYASVQNLMTITKYSFFDPEIGSNANATGGTANTSRGIDNGYFPQARTFMFGVQLGF